MKRKRRKNNWMTFISMHWEISSEGEKEREREGQREKIVLSSQGKALINICFVINIVHFLDNILLTFRILP